MKNGYQNLKLKLQKVPAIVWLLLLIVPTWINLAQVGTYSIHDDLQAFRIMQMNECFKDFQFPCRWIPDMGYQYGYPQFNFYGPSVYYLGNLIHLIGFQFIDSVKILFGLGLIVGGLGMYWLIYELLGSKFIAVVAAVLYSYSPYRAVNVYVRGAMNEFWAGQLLAFILLFIYRLIKKPNKKNLIILAFSIALLLITHNLMPLVLLPVAVSWGMFWLVAEKRISLIKMLIVAGLLGFALSAFFLLPVAVEHPFVHSEGVLGGYFDYRLHFVDLFELFVVNFWGYGSSVWGTDDGLSLSTGQLHFALALMSVLASILVIKKQKKLAILTIMLFGLSLLSLFLMHEKSSFVWTRLSFMAWMQFPWRLLALSSFLLSISVALLLNFGKETKYMKVLGISIIAGCLLLYGNFFRGHDWKVITDYDKFSGKSWQQQLTISIFDYLPIWAKLPPTSAAPAYPEILEGKADFISYKKFSDYQIGEINASSSALLRFPIFDFPGMETYVDGQVLPHVHTDCRGEEFCLGLVTAEIPSGRHRIEVRLTDTPIRLFANTLSAACLLGLVIWYTLGRNKKNEAKYS